MWVRSLGWEDPLQKEKATHSSILPYSQFFFVYILKGTTYLPRQEKRVWSLGQEDLLEKEMATHSNTLAYEIPWTGEPGRLVNGIGRVRRDLATKQQHNG